LAEVSAVFLYVAPDRLAEELILKMVQIDGIVGGALCHHQPPETRNGPQAQWPATREQSEEPSADAAAGEGLPSAAAGRYVQDLPEWGERCALRFSRMFFMVVASFP